MATPLEICSHFDYGLSVVTVIICGVLSLSIIYGLPKYTMVVQDPNISKKSKTLAIFFWISTILAMSFFTIALPITCFGMSYSFYQLSASLFLFFCGCQSFLLLFILFEKIKKTFEKTPDEISVCTLNFYGISFVAFPLFLIFLIASNVYIPIIYTLLLLIGMIWFLLLVLLLVVLFIHKLVSVYRSIANSTGYQNNQFIVHAITKVTILTLISIFIILSSTLCVITTSNRWLKTYLVTVDIYTNYVCVTLSYKQFDVYYSTFCKCMDKCCRMAWTKIINVDSTSIMHPQLDPHIVDQTTTSSSV